MQVRHSNVGDSYTEIVVPRPGDDDIPTTTTVSKPLYGKIRWATFTQFTRAVVQHLWQDLLTRMMRHMPEAQACR